LFFVGFLFLVYGYGLLWFVIGPGPWRLAANNGQQLGASWFWFLAAG
jgi:hypothetical protein